MTNHGSWLLGTAALLLMEASYLPQLLRLHRLKRADEVSLLFPSMNVGGRLLAMSYSLLAGQPVFAFGFTVGMLLRGTLLAQVLWYRRRAGWLAKKVGAERQGAALLEVA